MSDKSNVKHKFEQFIDYRGTVTFEDIVLFYHEMDNLEEENARLQKRLERMTKLASSLQEKLGKNV